MDENPSNADVYQRRFSGLARLFQANGLTRLAASHVLIVGIGGVGSWAAEALARSGIGQLSLVDLDHIAESNINRQVHANTQTVGASKVLAMTERIHRIHPLCRVTAIEDFVSQDNWSPLIAEHRPDAIIDACDELRAKEVMSAWALMHTPIPFITVGAAGGKRWAHAVDIKDLSSVSHDPLLAKLRYQLRRYHGAAKATMRMGINCVYSSEAVKRPAGVCAISGGPGSLGCQGYGSFVSVTASFGLCAAGWIVNQLVA